MLRNKNAITLIALVVTIVVLLILAGVSISLILDNNGIIAKSKDARLENRASQVEDEVGLWKQQNFINKESGNAQEDSDTMIASLISRGFLKEDEIDREQEIITIKKNDGTIVKQISYSQVTINISKSPENEKSGAVILTVESVEGISISTKTSKYELDEYIASLSEAQKKEIIKSGSIKLINKENPTANCKTFEDVLVLLKKSGEIEEATEESLWKKYGEEIDDMLFDILKIAYYDKYTNTIEVYNVINPDNEISNGYVAIENRNIYI